jgi:hypothetical protein
MAKFAFPPRRPRANLAAITSMETRMKTYPVTLLQLSILTATRAVAAGGLALLLSGKVGAELRKGIGWNLFALARRLTFCSHGSSLAESNRRRVRDPGNRSRALQKGKESLEAQSWRHAREISQTATRRRRTRACRFRPTPRHNPSGAVPAQRSRANPRAERSGFNLS